MRKILLATAALASVATAGAHSVHVSEPEISVICIVNGEWITDPGLIAAYTRESLELASDKLLIPGAILRTTLAASPALTKVGKMLNELINNR